MLSADHSALLREYKMDGYLPISYLNALEYCPRRFYYEYVQAEMVVNYHVLKGEVLHGGTHEHGRERIEAGMRVRQLTVWSHRLHLTGLADLVEVTQERKEQAMSDPSGSLLQVGAEANRQICPVEYKKGKIGRWLNDHIQLCAQAMCLEEMLGEAVLFGYVFYFESAHRLRVEFTSELRASTEAAVMEAHRLAASPTPPPPITNYNKCRDCSLEPMCMPREVRALRKIELGTGD